MDEKEAFLVSSASLALDQGGDLFQVASKARKSLSVF